MAREAWDLHASSAPERGGLIVLPTGVGKTALANWIASEHLAAGNRVFFLAHRVELIDQPYENMRSMFPEFGAMCGKVRASDDEPDQRMVYASKATLGNRERVERLTRSGRPSLVIVDEAHHSVSKQWDEILAHVMGPGTLLMGLTATPERDDGRPLAGRWDLVFAYAVMDAIRDGILLSPYAATWDVPELDLSQVSGRNDYNSTELWQAQAKAHIVEHTVAAAKAQHSAVRLPYRDSGKVMDFTGRSTIVFTSRVEQAQLTAAALQAAGFEARWVSGNTPPAERRMLLRAFGRGDIQFMCNAAALTEGTDIPRVNGIMLVRPTRSRPLYLQMLGRGLRLFEEQDDCLLVDIAAGASRQHSLVSAPCLIASGCEGAPDGNHRWMVGESSPEGVCGLCGTVVACGRRGGPHRFKDGHCVSCGQEQCPGTPDHRHVWIAHPAEVGCRVCTGCALQMPDQIASLIGRRPPPERVPAAWQRLKTPGHVLAVNLGRQGILFNVKGGSGWSPVWAPRVGAPVKLAPYGPLEEREAAEVCWDVMRQCERVAGLAGGRRSPKDYRNGFNAAEDVARRLLVWTKN